MVFISIEEVYPFTLLEKLAVSGVGLVVDSVSPRIREKFYRKRRASASVVVSYPSRMSPHQFSKGAGTIYRSSPRRLS